jgi:hypothetical protein
VKYQLVNKMSDRKKIASIQISDGYKSTMDWCSVYLTPQGLPKYIYLSPPLIFPTTYNGIRTKNRPVWITPSAARIRWMGPIRNPNWSTSGMRVTSSYLCYKELFNLELYT